MLQIAFHVDVE